MDDPNHAAVGRTCDEIGAETDPSSSPPLALASFVRSSRRARPVS